MGSGTPNPPFTCVFDRRFLAGSVSTGMAPGNCPEGPMTKSGAISINPHYFLLRKPGSNGNQYSRAPAPARGGKE
jgi:hypothetical protein